MEGSWMATDCVLGLEALSPATPGVLALGLQYIFSHTHTQQHTFSLVHCLPAIVTSMHLIL